MRRPCVVNAHRHDVQRSIDVPFAPAVAQRPRFDLCSDPQPAGAIFMEAMDDAALKLFKPLKPRWMPCLTTNQPAC